MIFLSKKAVQTASERITCLAGLDVDKVASKLRELIAAGDWLDGDRFDAEHDYSKALVLPQDARTSLGDRVAIILVPDRFTKGDEVAVVVKPLRSVLKVPAHEKAKGPAPERIVKIVGLPTYEEIVASGAAVFGTSAPVEVDAPEVPEPADVETLAPAKRVRQRIVAGLSRGAALLQNEIIRRGMSRTEAAAAVGVQENSIRRWSRGQDIPRMSHAARMQELFGVPIGAWVESL